jgi:hypothetical protein
VSTTLTDLRCIKSLLIGVNRYIDGCVIRSRYESQELLEKAPDEIDRLRVDLEIVAARRDQLKAQIDCKCQNDKQFSGDSERAVRRERSHHA